MGNILTDVSFAKLTTKTTTVVAKNEKKTGGILIYEQFK